MDLYEECVLLQITTFFQDKDHCRSFENQNIAVLNTGMDEVKVVTNYQE